MKENELEFSDWPMFDLLMTNEELCRELLEVVLDAPVSNIEYIIAENDIRPTLTNHGVRLDAYVKTENEVCNIEMQTVKRLNSVAACASIRAPWTPWHYAVASTTETSLPATSFSSACTIPSMRGCRYTR